MKGSCMGTLNDENKLQVDKNNNKSIQETIQITKSE